MSNDVLSSLRLDARAVQGGTKQAAAAAAGKPLPVTGESAPPAVRAPEIKLPEPADLSRMVEKLNDYLRQNSRNLHFRYDDTSGRTVITVVDASTGDVVRQIPSEELLAMAERMRIAAQAGSLINLRA